MSCPPSYFECSTSSGGGCCPRELGCFQRNCVFRNGTIWGPQIGASDGDSIASSFRGLSILFAVLAIFIGAFCWAVFRRMTISYCSRGGFAPQPPPQQQQPPPAALVLHVPAGAPPAPSPPPPPPLPAQELQPDPAQWRAVPLPLKKPLGGSLGLLIFEAVEGKGVVVRSLTPASPLRGRVLPGDRLLQIGDGEGAVNVLAAPFEEVRALLAQQPPTMLVFLRHTSRA